LAKEIVVVDSGSVDNTLSIVRRFTQKVFHKDWEGYKLIGAAEYFAEGKWKEFVEKMPENKEMPAKGAILITVSELIKLG